MKRPRYRRTVARPAQPPAPPASAMPALSDEELWQRTMQAVDIVLGGNLRHDPVAVTQGVVGALHGLSLDRVRELDAATYHIMAAEGLALVSRMILHLGTIPAKPIPD